MQINMIKISKEGKELKAYGYELMTTTYVIKQQMSETTCNIPGKKEKKI